MSTMVLLKSMYTLGTAVIYRKYYMKKKLSIGILTRLLLEICRHPTNNSGEFHFSCGCSFNRFISILFQVFKMITLKTCADGSKKTKSLYLHTIDKKS